MDIRDWLRAIGLEQYAGAFLANAVDVDNVAELTDGDLQSLGVAALMHRKKIVRAAVERGPQASSAAASAGAATSADAMGAMLPTVLAVPLAEARHESHPTAKLWAYCDFAELSLRFCLMAGCAEFEGRIPASVRSRIAVAIERPTMGQWMMMARTVAEALPRDTMVPELTALVTTLEHTLGARDAGPERGLLALRNRLAHGGGLRKAEAAELVNGWNGPFAALVAAHGWWSDVELVGVADGVARRFRGPDPAGQPYGAAPPLLPAGTLALVRGGRMRALWPLAHFGALDPEAPDRVAHVFARRGEVRLEYTPLGGSSASSELGDDALKAFLRIFSPDLPPQHMAIRGFEAEVRQEAARRIGRARELELVLGSADALVAGHATHVWLDGAAGMGKSNLMASCAAHWLDNPRVGVMALPYRFKAGDERLSRQAFFRYCVERLDGWEGLSPDCRDADDKARPEDRFEEQLSGVADGHRILFLVDGIDEIAERDESFVRDVILRRRPDARVGWLCAGRPERGLPELFKDAARPFPSGLPPLSADDVRAILFERLARGNVRKRLLERDVEKGERVLNPFLQRVLERSEGLPIYVNHVVGDLLSGRLSPDQEALLPNGLRAFHEQLLARCSIGALQQVLTPTAAMLGLVRRAIGQAEIWDLLSRANLLTDEPSSLKVVGEALASLAPMLRRSQRDDGSDGYSLFHHSLRQHLHESPAMRLVLDTARENLRRASREPDDWRRPAAGYVYRFGVSHLVESGHLDEAARLLSDFALLGARFAALGDAVAVAATSEDWETLAKAAPLTPDGASWESLWRQTMLFLHHVDPAWPAERILAQCARDRASDDAAGRAATRYFEQATHPWLESLAERPLLPHANACTMTLLGHRDTITAVDLTVDGSRIVTASGRTGNENGLREWSSAGTCLRRWSGAPAPLTSVVMLPGGTHALAGGEDGTLWWFEFSSGAMLGSWRHHDGGVRDVQRIDDARLISAGAGGEMVAFGWPGREVLWRRTVDASLRHLAAHHDRGLVAVAADSGRLHVVRSDDGVTALCVEAHPGGAHAVTFSPDGSLLASGGADNTLRLWRADSGAAVRTWGPFVDGIEAIAFSPDGALVAFGLSHLGAPGYVEDASLHVVELATGELRRYPGHSDEIRGLRFSADGRRCVTVSRDETVRVWDVELLRRPPPGGEDATLALERLTTAPDGTIAGAGWDRHVHLQLPDRRRLRLGGHASPVYAVVFLGEDRIVSGGEDGELRVWTRTGEHIRSVCPGPRIDAIAPTADGRTVVVSTPMHTEDRPDVLAVVDTHDGVVVRRLRTAPRRELTREPLAVYRATGGDRGRVGGATVLGAYAADVLGEWDLLSGELLGLVRGFPNELSGVATVAERDLWICSDQSGGIHRVSASQRRILGKLADHHVCVRTLATSPSGSLCATGCDDGGLRVYDLDTGQLIAAWFFDTWIVSVAFIDEDHIAAGMYAAGWRTLRIRGRQGRED